MRVCAKEPPRDDLVAEADLRRRVSQEDMRWWVWSLRSWARRRREVAREVRDEASALERVARASCWRISSARAVW